MGANVNNNQPKSLCENAEDRKLLTAF